MQEASEEKTDEKKKRAAAIATFPVGDVIASVKIKSDREPTEADLRHSITACQELAAQIAERLAAMKAAQ